MLICLCTGTTKREIEDLCRGGATMEQVMRVTGAGTECGSCRPTLHTLCKRAQQGHRDARVEALNAAE